jgi:hypothetical protein
VKALLEKGNKELQVLKVSGLLSLDLELVLREGVLVD